MTAGVRTVTDAPMTLGQKFQWYLERGIADEVRRLPDDWSTAAAGALVTALQARFEILRTTVEPTADGHCQRVHGAGEPLVVVDVGDEDPVGALAARFGAEVAGQTGRFLVRFHLIRRGTERLLYTVADSVAADRAFFGLLDRAIEAELGNRPAERPEGLQPAQLAAREHGAEGADERAAAEKYLRTYLETAPRALYPERHRRAGPAGRYYRCSLTLPGADSVFARVVDSTGRLPSAVVLGVFGALFGHRARVSACTVNVSWENRHTRELRSALCGTAQRAPVVLRWTGHSVGAAITAAERALADGYPAAGRYDANDLLRLRRVAEAERGICLRPDLAFNFNPPLQGWTALLGSDPVPAEVPPGSISGAPTRETFYEYGASLSIRWRDTRTAVFSMHADSTVLTPDACAVLLREIENCLAAIASGGETGDLHELAPRTTQARERR